MDNPTLMKVKKGDTFTTALRVFRDQACLYVSFVTKVYDIEKHFGNDDRIIEVCIRSIPVAGGDINIVDKSRMLWHSELSKGLV